MSAPNCPKCGAGLMRVCYPIDSYLSRDQFESVKAGDWYCTRCADSSTRSGYTYFWDKDLPVPLVPETELTATKLKLALAEARVKELEGLEVELTKHPTTGDYVLVTVRIKRDAHKPCKFNLGDAMPRKEGV